MDILVGGLGDDIYVVDSIVDIIAENANEGIDSVQSSRSYALSANVETLTLTGTTAISGIGNSLDNLMVGNSANNILSAGAGSDTLNGGAGADTLIGGLGNDIFVFSTVLGSTNVDTILGFTCSSDVIQLENAIFTGLTTTGTLAASAFVTGTAAADANDRIIYNASTGDLFYDADGTGATAAVKFATLVGVQGTVSASNFAVI